MKPSQSLWIRALSLCLLFILLISPVLPASAAPLGDLITVSESVEIPPEAVRGDAEEMSKVHMGLVNKYMKHYKTDDGNIEFPDYFGGFTSGTDLLPIMCLTEFSDEILAEIRTAFYSYRSERATEEEVIQYMDKWFPTIRYQLVEYSYKQLYELQKALKVFFQDVKRGEYNIQVDCKNNQVILFCDTEVQKDEVNQAVTLTDKNPSILKIMPIAQFDAWVEERSAPPAVQSTEPVEPSAEMAGKVMPGMKNAFYKANGTMSSGTVGFTAFLTYNGRGDDDLGLERGDTVEAVFTHGHDISGLYPYSSINNMYSADLLGYGARVDYSFYMPRGNVSISGKRYGSTEYFTEYCASEYEISLYANNSLNGYVYFYGDTSGERSFTKYNLQIDSGTVYWENRNAISQPGDSGCPIFFSLDEVGQEGENGYALIAIMSTSNANSGGEGQTIYSIINDIEYNTDYTFDEFCTG